MGGQTHSVLDVLRSDPNVPAVLDRIQIDWRCKGLFSKRHSVLLDALRRSMVISQIVSGLHESMNASKLTPNPDFVSPVDGTILPALAKSSYEYRKLEEDDEIRLLEVFPASEGDEHAPLRGRIVHARLSDSPAYTALSYCWNSLGISSPTCNRDPILDLRSEGILVLTQSIRRTRICVQKWALRKKHVLG